jgi:hypothetical protein
MGDLVMLVAAAIITITWWSVFVWLCVAGFNDHYFWVVAIPSLCFALLSTGGFFHCISELRERRALAGAAAKEPK